MFFECLIRRIAAMLLYIETDRSRAGQLLLFQVIFLIPKLVQPVLKKILASACLPTCNSHRIQLKLIEKLNEREKYIEGIGDERCSEYVFKSIKFLN